MNAPVRSLTIGLGLTLVSLALASALAQTQPETQNTTAESAPASTTSANHATSSLRLGTVHFPTSGAPEAQPHFLHGVAALHSFWYEEALEAFARAVKIDPDFAMAHWGEAMCYHRSYRPGSDTSAGRRAIAKIRDTARLTPREKAYIDAVRTLYGTTGSAKTSEYAKAMEQLHRAHPGDLEATAFYSLALLGLRGDANMAKAGKLAETVYRANPDHPGAAHYIIHAYDNPTDAKRALYAANQYAQIAPDAPHALHMPSHIYVQLGMWREAATSNDEGWTASVDYVRRKDLSPTLRDYHNLHWLIYAALQEGRHARATELVNSFVQMRANNELASYSARYINSAFAAYIIETGNWAQAEALFAKARALASARSAAAGEIELCGVDTLSKRTNVSNADTPALFAAFAKAFTEGVEPDPALIRLPKIRELQVTGVARAHAKDFRTAIGLLREAAEMEAKSRRPVGPPVEKPAHELLGEVLLDAGQPARARAEFKIALDRHPNRALSLLGLARAEAAIGNKSAARVSYTRLLEIWRHADATLPALQEARDFVQSTG